MIKLHSMRKRSILLFTMVFVLTMMLVPMSAAAQTIYPDLSGHEAQATIQAMIDKGYVTGYEDGTFKPDQNISRAEFMAMIRSAFGAEIPAPVDLTGVEAMAWYVNAWSDGDIGNGEIAGAENPVTNEEAAVIFAHLKSLVADEAAAGIFIDADLASTWSRGAIGAVSKAGIMKGYTDGTFRPDQFISRAEASTALKAALEYTMIKPLFIVNNHFKRALDIEGVDILGESIVVFHSNLEGAQITWNGVTLEGVTTVQGTNAINVPAFVPGEVNTLSIRKPGHGSFNASDIVWGETGPQIVNGDFETGDFEGWQVEITGSFPQIQSDTVADGVYAAYLGDGAEGMYPGNGAAAISQAISISEWGTPYLNLDYLINGTDYYDVGGVILKFDGLNIYIDETLLAEIRSIDSSGWKNGQYDLSAYAGQDAMLTISSWTADDLEPVHYFVDNVSLSYGSVTGEAPTPVKVTATPIRYGQTLSNSILSGTFLDQDGNEVSGTLTWLEPDKTVDGSGAYVCIFTPDDGGNYLVVANTVKVNAAKDRHKRTNIRTVGGTAH